MFAHPLLAFPIHFHEGLLLFGGEELGNLLIQPLEEFALSLIHI